eukprot:scaffold41183_cov52-Phaeocystis_antarctica.AAC.1
MLRGHMQVALQGAHKDLRFRDAQLRLRDAQLRLEFPHPRHPHRRRRCLRYLCAPPGARAAPAGGILCRLR